MKILDVGCGPGTLTCDFAKLVPQGSVIGLDQSKEVVGQARELGKSRGLTNISFTDGDVFALDYSDGEFDIVHAHQVLHHVGDASGALREMRRITKPGGIVAVRDMSDFLHWPHVKELEQFSTLFVTIAEGVGAVPRSGAQYRRFAREAGFSEDEVTIGAGTWCFATEGDLEFWCGKS
jgi:ubiquinone/menaquinone biosynthesis C-methylase UbiE